MCLCPWQSRDPLLLEGFPVSLGCPGQSLPRKRELLASPHRSALTVLPFAAGLATFLESFLVARGGFCRGHTGSRPIRIPKLQPQPCAGVWGLTPHSPVPCWEVSKVCVLAGSRQRWRCRTPKHEPKPTG